MSWLDGVKQRTAELIDDPAGVAEMLVDQLRNRNKGVRPVIAGGELTNRPIPQDERNAEYMSDALSGGSGLAGVMKPKGGNWLKDPINSFGTATMPAMEPGATKAHDAMDDFTSKALASYLKNRFGSPDDEVRRLADEGITHLPNTDQMAPADTLVKKLRKQQGFPAEGMAKTPLGTNWENRADRHIMPFTGKEAKAISSVDSPGESNPVYDRLSKQHRRKEGAARGLRRQMKDSPGEFDWLSKTSDDQQLYQLHGPQYPSAQLGVGLDHLSDEISNALRGPASGLPRNLQLTPEAASNMSMEKAVRLVDGINKWRAKQQTVLSKELLNKAATVREYPDDPAGMRWVELKASENTPVDTYAVAKERAAKEGLTPDHPDYYDILDEYAYEVGGSGGTFSAKTDAQLAEQLKYEGDVMKHCVGGYCDDVLAGKKRIFSLRDANGEPHTTVEVVHSKSKAFRDDNPNDFDEFMGNQARMGINEDAAMDAWEKHNVKLSKSNGYSIEQIRGKSNTTKNPKYQKYVDDFINNPVTGTPWGRVKY